MAVLVRQLINVSGEEILVDSYLPSRALSAEERRSADELDLFLQSAIPALEERIATELDGNRSLVRKWYFLGLALREIIEDNPLIMSADVDSGDFWKAVWWYLPKGLRPRGRGGESLTYGIGHKRKDHLSLCYEMSAHRWEAIGWIQRWDDWHQISFRPTISRDPRILSQLGGSIAAAERYPKRKEFREIVKSLGDIFPTRQFVNTEVLTDKYVAEAIHAVVRRVIAG